jgi:hypothetical protein
MAYQSMSLNEVLAEGARSASPDCFPAAVSARFAGGCIRRDDIGFSNHHWPSFGLSIEPNKTSNPCLSIGRSLRGDTKEVT